MPRAVPSRAQSFLSSVILPLLSLYLVPVSLTAVVLCVLHDRVRALLDGQTAQAAGTEGTDKAKGMKGQEKRGCVIISGGRMSKGLHLARAFKRAGWEVVGVEEKGWGDLCPLRFSSAISHFYLLPLASSSYPLYASTLTSIAKRHGATLFIPVSGAGSSVEDARAADAMYAATSGRCKTFIQDPETMEDLHDKDRFMQLVARMGMPVPRGTMVKSVQEAMEFLEGEGEPRYVLKCMGLDENRGDMTLFPLKSVKQTSERLKGLKLGISKECPYVFQEFIPGQEYCTHASVTDGQLTSFLVCPSNDMLMTYQDATSTPVGRAAEQWTLDLLSRMRNEPTPSGNVRRLTGHFSFDFIQSTKDGQLYPIECNARVHTAVVLLPLDKVAGCYDSFVQNSSSKQGANGVHKQSVGDKSVLRPDRGTMPRSWSYNNIIMRLLPALIPSKRVLGRIHPSLPACLDSQGKEPKEGVWQVTVEPTLVADDWVPFLVLWHLWWPALLLQRWWRGVRWTRVRL